MSVAIQDLSQSNVSAVISFVDASGYESGFRAFCGSISDLPVPSGSVDAILSIPWGTIRGCSSHGYIGTATLTFSF
ncbi:MAG: hypothetical protein ACYDCC_08515 [Actinomycetota bacterium]